MPETARPRSLEEAAIGRDNNFNLIRMLAASAVLWSHSFPLTGHGEAEPFLRAVGVSLGTLAVDVFFVASGFLVTGSLLVRRNTLDFLKARALRIYPALVVVLLLSAFVLGPAFTSKPLAAYFASSELWTYLLRGITLLKGVAFELPGVFEENPYPKAVNGSLWTLPLELRMYLYLALGWGLLWFLNDKRAHAFVILVVVVALISGGADIVRMVQKRPEDPGLHLLFMFFSGAGFWVFRRHIALRLDLCVAFVVLLALSTTDPMLFRIAFSLTAPYLLFYCAYARSPLLLRYNQIGDYSYGLYIWAFPIQQAIAALIPGCATLTMMLLSFAVTLCAAIASWRVIEAPALRLKHLPTAAKPASGPA